MDHDIPGLLRSLARQLDRHRWSGPDDWMDFKAGMSAALKRHATEFEIAAGAPPLDRLPLSSSRGMTRTTSRTGSVVVVDFRGTRRG